jgi:NIPSNAP
MNDANRCVLEIRMFKVRPGTREEFHRISRDGTVPLMRRCGIDVVAHGPMVNDENGYLLLRAFASERERRAQSQAVYATAEWEQCYETPVMGMIEDYRIAVMPATPRMVADLAAEAARA